MSLWCGLSRLMKRTIMPNPRGHWFEKKTSEMTVPLRSRERESEALQSLSFQNHAL